METQHWKHPPARDPESWFCNVVWGGNQLVLESFTMPGLDGYLLSVPSAGSPAGGDIYHVSVCDHGVFSKFLLIDVAGHGHAASGIASNLQKPLFRLMNELDNSAILEELNENILARENQGDFATAAAATYNNWDRSWTYAYAGHPYMLIRRNDHWQPLPECCAGPPVGVLGEIRYFQNEVKLNGEDWVFLFSDAVFEIRQDNGERLGFDGMVALLNSIDADEIGTFYQSLVDALVSANGSDCFNDDLTLILLKQKPGSQKLGRRTLSGIQRLLMRWMKRKEVRCSTNVAELPGIAKV